MDVVVERIRREVVGEVKTPVVAQKAIRAGAPVVEEVEEQGEKDKARCQTKEER